MTQKLARKTIDTIEKALQEKKPTAIREIIQLVQDFATKTFTLPVSELSELIGRDATITARVISMANTLEMNPTGSPISTISEAVHKVGFEKIRNLAISILLVENAGQALNNYEQREIASMTVCCGLMAQQLSEKQKLSIDSEQAFVCASLRNYGALLMSSFMVEKYREAKSIALEEGEERGFKAVFGISPISVGQRLLSATNLPKVIIHSLDALPPKATSRPPKTQKDELLLISELSARVCEAAFDSNLDPEQFEDSLAAIANRFGRALPISIDSIREAFVVIDNDLELFSHVIGPHALSTPAAANIRARVTEKPLPERPKESRISPRPKPKILSEMDETEREEYAEDRFQQAIKRLSEALPEKGKIDLEEIYKITVEAITAGLDLSSCMVFLQEEREPDAFSARYGFGQLYQRIRNRPLVSLQKQDIFSICISRKEDVLIQDVAAGKIKSVIPEWVEINSQTTSLLLLPVARDKDVFAIIACSLDEGSITLDKNDHRRLTEIRKRLSQLQERIAGQATLKIA